jgi:protein-S-isoprenylcysteine O-methyltransferase Ste14
VVELSAGRVIAAAWLVWLVWWLISATRLNAMKKREPFGEWLLRWVVMAVAFELLFGSGGNLDVLNRRFVPYSPNIRGVGAALTCVGVAFSIWARQHIGRYWSSTVSLRADHQLIRTGPYARIRHPIYTGMLLALAGTVLANGHDGAIAAFAMLLVGFSWKAVQEEHLLAREFGPAFEDHKRLTGFFLPRFP